MANINKIRLSGQTYDIEDLNAPKSVELTQAQYNALVSGGTVDPNTFYIITDATAGDLTAIENRLSEDEEVTAAGLNALNDAFGGMKLVKLSEAEYNALATKDSSTLYIIVN